MRIISGKARGTKLYTLEGEATRPTLDRVKESIFNMIQADIRDSIFLDLFAGSGAIGLEAASRGAKQVILCEKSKNATQVIRKNIEKTHTEDVVCVYEMDYETCLKTQIEEPLDIVYIDPPYHSSYVGRAIKLLLERKLVKEQSLILVETDQEVNVLEEIKSLDVEIVEKRKYGRATIIFLKQGQSKSRKG